MFVTNIEWSTATEVGQAHRVYWHSKMGRKQFLHFLEFFFKALLPFFIVIRTPIGTVQPPSLLLTSRFNAFAFWFHFSSTPFKDQSLPLAFLP